MGGSPEVYHLFVNRRENPGRVTGVATLRDEPHRFPDGSELRLRPAAHAMFTISDMPDAEPWLIGRSRDGLWLCELRFARIGEDIFSAYEMHLEPWLENEAVPLGTKVLAELPLHQWTLQAQTAMAKRFKEEGSPEATAIAEATVAKPGPKGFGTDFYRQLALEYLRLQGQGVGRGIRTVLADWMTETLGDKYDEANVKDALVKAVNLGFLSHGTQGRAGRDEGPNLYVTKTKKKNNRRRSKK